jgi:hypothetical protein
MPSVKTIPVEEFFVLRHLEVFAVSSLVSADLQSKILSMHYGAKMGVRTIAREVGLNRCKIWVIADTIWEPLRTVRSTS